MASRLTTILRWYQEIAGSTPAVVIYFCYIWYLFAASPYLETGKRTTYSILLLFKISSLTIHRYPVERTPSPNQRQVSLVRSKHDTWECHCLKQQTIFKISRLCTILSLTHSGPSQRDRHHPRLQRSTISYHELVHVFQFYSLSPLGSYIISARNT